MLPTKQSKLLYFSDTARSALMEGVNQMADMVKMTLGPKGKNITLMTSFGTAHTTKDGVTVANAINLKNPAQDLGAQMLRQAASRTLTGAGDGTTTSIILAQSILKSAIKSCDHGVSPIDIKRGMESAVTKVVEYLKSTSSIVNEDYDLIEQIATISANNDARIGKLIRDAMELVGPRGMVGVADSKTTEDTITFTKGYSFDKGFVSPYFVTNQKVATCEYEDPYILVTDNKLRSSAELIPVLEQVSKKGAPLLIIADEIEAQALQLLLVNRLQANLKVVAVKAPAFGDRRLSMLEDIAVVTGATLVSETSGLLMSQVRLEHLGRATKVIISKDGSTIIGGKGDQEVIDARVEELQAEVSRSSAEFQWVREKLLERLSKLAAGVALINLGAHTEIELKEKKDRVDDALRATQAAVEEGISIGGGYTYLKAALALECEDSKMTDGYMAVKAALKSIFYTVLENANLPAAVIENHILNSKEFYDVNKMEYVSIDSCKVIDPTKVLRLALENAVSVASMIILTSGIVTSPPMLEGGPDDESEF